MPLKGRKCNISWKKKKKFNDHRNALKSSAEKKLKNGIVYIPAIKIIRIFTKKDNV